MVKIVCIILLLFLTNIRISQTWTFYPEDYSSYFYTTYLPNEYFIAAFYPNEANNIITDLRTGINKYPLSASVVVIYSIDFNIVN